MLLDQFDLLLDAPDSVPKLRELILDLAIRGTLVEQDPEDEPASTLIERAEQEIQRLYKKGGIRKPKKLPRIADEGPYSLPKGWSWSRLGTMGVINPRNDAADDTSASFIPMALINDGFGTGHDFEERIWGEISSGYTHFAEGDVGMAKITPCFQNRKSTIFRNLTNGIGAGTTELHIFRPVAQTLLREYVLIFVQSPRFIEEGIATMTGTAGQQRVSRSYFEEGRIPIAPLAEQQRIVAKVGELMRLCDELEAQQTTRQSARTHLNNASLNALQTADEAEFHRRWGFVRDHFELLYEDSQNVQALRQAVLQLAVRGKLVEQDPSDEPAAVLLDRIEEEKRRLYKEGKIRKQKKLKPVVENERPFDLPQGWSWTRLGAVAKDVEYGTSQKAHADGVGIPVLRMNNIEDGKVVLQNLKYVPATTKDLPRLYLDHNDLLFNRTNSYELVGKTGVYKGAGEEMTFASYLIRASFLPEDTNVDYVNIYMNSPVCRSTQIEPEITQQTNQANFNGTKLRNVLISLPPVKEQLRIVTRVGELMRLCDELEAQLVRSQEKATGLLEAVLREDTTETVAIA